MSAPHIRPSARDSVALFIAGINSAGMGAYHFFLPHVWGWESFLAKLPPMVHWGVHAINTFFSALLFAGGALTLTMLRHGMDGPIARGLLLAMTLCWEINVVHQIVVPVPMPPQMIALRMTLLGFSILTTLAYGYATLRAWHSKVGNFSGPLASG